MRRAITKVGYWLNGVVVIPLLLAYLAVHISPELFWPLAFFGLTYPIWLALNLLFILLWGILRKRYILLSLVAILIGWNHLTDFWGFHPGGGAADNGVKIMTYNVKNFDLYNWQNSNESRAQMMNTMQTAAPDILCVQEFYTKKTGTTDNLRALQQQLQLPYTHHYSLVTLPTGASFGLVTFSRYPIVGKGHIDFAATKNACLYTDVLIEQDTIRIYNLHLQSIYLGNEGEDYVQRLLREQDTDVASSRRILHKLKRGYINRAPQASAVAAAIRECPHPVILCGDFNDTPVSYTYHTLSAGLHDAFRKGGWGIGATFAGRIPGLRIDHLLIDPTLTINGYERLTKVGSDHYPVVAWWTLPE